MDYRIEQDGSSAKVIFNGDITFSENVHFRAMLKELSGLTLSACEFDLDGVDMIDSAGLGMFLIAREQAEKGNWTIKVSGAKGHVASMLKLTKLSDLLNG